MSVAHFIAHFKRHKRGKQKGALELKFLDYLLKSLQASDKLSKPFEVQQD